MRNDRLFDALAETPNDPAPAGDAITADDLQAFEKRIVESVNAKLTEKLDAINKKPEAGTATPTAPETTPAKAETPTESEEK